MSVVFSGIQPTGNLHLGNYLGAIKQWVIQQNYPKSLGAQLLPKQPPKCIFCIVDLHAITIHQNPTELYEASLKTAATYLACGIDPKQSIIFAQSGVPEHTELAWILNCHTPLGWLNRMTQFKDKAGKHKDQASLGLYAYPVLMAADILLYQTTEVPVGEDQKQHIELARDIAEAFNRHYGENVFTVPEPKISSVATRVMSLRDGTKKMSKSDESDYSRINLTDTPDQIRLKIQKAKTDPDLLPTSIEELENRPEAKNLLTLFNALLNHMSLENIINITKGQSFSMLKQDLANGLVMELQPISREIHRYMTDGRDELQRILDEGAEQARARAEVTMKRVKEVVGFYQPRKP